MKQSIQIRPITESDTQLIIKWRNDPQIVRNLYTQDMLTQEQHLRWLHNYVNTGKCSQFIIEECMDVEKRAIGTVFIKNIDTKNSKGEFGIFIGEKFARGLGYGTAATKEILYHTFEVLGLNRVYLTVFHDNIYAIKAYKQAGFEQEGILKQDFLRYDGYCDVLCMGITAERWKQKQITENNFCEQTGKTYTKRR